MIRVDMVGQDRVFNLLRPTYYKALHPIGLRAETPTSYALDREQTLKTPSLKLAHQFVPSPLHFSAVQNPKPWALNPSTPNSKVRTKPNLTPKNLNTQSHKNKKPLTLYTKPPKANPGLASRTRLHSHFSPSSQRIDLPSIQNIGALTIMHGLKFKVSGVGFFSRRGSGNPSSTV